MRNEGNLPREITEELTSLRRRVAELETLEATYQKTMAEFKKREQRVLDIIKNKKVLEALRRNEEKFRSIFDQIKDAVFIETVDGKILDANKAACNMLGYTREKILSMMVSDLVAPHRAATLSPTIREESIKDRVYIETEELLNDGRLIPVEVSNTLVDIGGEERVIAILRDISARKKAEDALRKSEEKYRALVENSPDVIMRFDRELRHTFVSRPVTRYVDIPPVDFLGKTHLELGFPLNMCDFWKKHIRKVFESGEPHQVEFELEGKSGKVIFEWLLIPEFTVERTTDTVLAVSRDITIRKRTEEQLRHAQKMEAIGTLSGGLAHDFNNILGGIMGFASLLERNFDTADPIAKDLREIGKLAKRGANLTQALLTFAKKMEYRSVPLEIDRVCKGVIKMISKTVKTGIDIKIDLSPNVANVRGDDGQLSHVLMNLCLNACQAMPRGGIMTVATSDVEPAEDFFAMHPRLERGPYVIVEVSDTGVGMDEKTRKRIFEPFFTTKNNCTGTGLGLAIANGIIGDHGGCIEVESEPGKGSRFIVYLPATVEEVSEKREKPVQSLRGSERILVVDDERGLRESTARWLTQLGYAVEEAESGEEALEIVRRGEVCIELVVLDMVMGGMGGKQTLEILREIRPGLPVIITTGFSFDSECMHILEKGPGYFLKKPFRLTEFAASIRRLFDNR